MQDLESHETSGLLPKQSSTNETQPKRRAVALTIVVALVATTALVNLVPTSGRGGGLRRITYPRTSKASSTSDKTARRRPSGRTSSSMT